MGEASTVWGELPGASGARGFGTNDTITAGSVEKLRGWPRPPPRRVVMLFPAVFFTGLGGKAPR